MNVYIYQAALLCEACGIATRAELPAPPDVDDESSYDSDDYPKGPERDGGGEADSPQHCDACNAFLENPLTSDGEAYVRDAIERALIEGKSPSVALDEWAPFYGIEPEDPRAIRLGRMAPAIRELADEKTGELDAYTSIGCYPLFYLTDKSCDVVCAKCANDHQTGVDAFGGEKIGHFDTNWEDPDLWCDCGERIPSAYTEDEIRDDETEIGSDV